MGVGFSWISILHGKLAHQNCAGCCHLHCIAICYDHHHRPPPPCHLICQLTPTCKLFTLAVFYSYSLILKKALWLQMLVLGRGWCCPKGTTYTFANTCKATILLFPPLIWNLFSGKVIAAWKLAGASGQVDWELLFVQGWPLIMMPLNSEH